MFMRVMALDIGEVRTGIAISDPGRRVSSPICVMPTQEVVDNSRKFQELLENWAPELLVCGLPRSLSGEQGSQADRIRKVAEAITKACGIPHVFSDERLSSREAKQALREMGYDEKKMRGKVDMVAASLFLQSWLDSEARKQDQNTEEN